MVVVVFFVVRLRLGAVGGPEELRAEAVGDGAEGGGERDGGDVDAVVEGVWDEEGAVVDVGAGVLFGVVLVDGLWRWWWWLAEVLWEILRWRAGEVLFRGCMAAGWGKWSLGGGQGSSLSFDYITLLRVSEDERKRVTYFS